MVDRGGMRPSQNIDDVRGMRSEDVLTDIIMNLMQPEYQHPNPKGLLADQMHAEQSPLGQQLGTEALKQMFYQQLMEMRPNGQANEALPPAKAGANW